MEAASLKTEPDYEALSDEALVAQSKNDVQALEFLLEKYKNFVRIKARPYFILGADHEDIIQEGMIGLYKAIRDFNPAKTSYFRVFAELCITRQMITAIKAANRQKHIPLNSYVSLNRPLYDGASDQDMMDHVQSQSMLSPEELFISREDMKSITLRIQELLSQFERQVLSLYLEGKSYQEISSALKRHTKSVDNALQRVKRKLSKHLMTGENGMR
ncbi:MAG: RNA polymerase sporulation sigma factor SigH [Christensenellales bacterium]|jgi:RNA polymerase sporulation-specific sigma factor